MILKAKKLQLLFIMTLACILAVGCSGENNSKGKDHQLSSEDFKESKQQVTQDLQDLKQKADDRIDELDKKLENASEANKAKINEVIEKIKDKRNDIDAQLQKVKLATIDSWNDVKMQAEKTVNEAEDAIKKAGDEIKNLFEAENKQ